jgi:repressor LexA
MSEITEKQRETMLFIQQYIADKGYPPTRAEIAGHFGTCPNAVEGILQRLDKNECISLSRGVSRGIKVLKSL